MPIKNKTGNDQEKVRCLLFKHNINANGVNYFNYSDNSFNTIYHF
jgi:hypothetical protein